jgi:iron complex outermembrane receptor protein
MKNRFTLKSSCLALAIASCSSTYVTAALEEIVITAQKKAESIQDAAIAIDASGAEELGRIGVTGAQGLNKISPALTIVNGGGANNVFFVRGVGNFAVNAYTDSACAFNVVGVFIGRPTATTASFLDLERVEVLKGPQGTLYGRNATAGAINILPAKPQLGETSGKLSVGFGNYGTIQASGAVNIEMGDSWASRFAIGKNENDGYNDDGTAATDDLAFRGQIFGELSDTTTMRISVDHSTSKGTGTGPTFLGKFDLPFAGPSVDEANNIVGFNFKPAPANVSAAHTGALTTEAQAYYTGLTDTPGFTSPLPLIRPFLDNSFSGISAEFNIDLGFGDLVIIPAYREAEMDLIFNNPGFQAAINQEDHTQASLEARLSMTTGDIDWIMGAFYFDEDIDALAAFNQHSVQNNQAIESDTDSSAVFVRGTFHASDSLRLVAAVRYTNDEKSFSGVADSLLSLCERFVPPVPVPNCQGNPSIPAALTADESLALLGITTLAGPGAYPFFGQFGPGTNLLIRGLTVVEKDLDNDEVTYRAAVEYDINDDSMLYTSYETGYRSGGFSITTGRESFEPEYLNAFTIGSKNRFMDDRLQVNAELFVWDYEDQQSSHLGSDINGRPSFFTENIGQSSIQGLELDVLFAATDSTILKANLQYLDNEIDEYSYEQNTPDVAVNPVSGCGAATLLGVRADDSADWSIDCAGKQGRNSPEYALNVGIEQTFDFDNVSALVSVDARYRDERFNGFEFLPIQHVESVTTVDASVELASNDGDWSVLFYARNITDEEIRSTTQVLGSVSRVVSATYEPPRTYGATLNYNF